MAIGVEMTWWHWSICGGDDQRDGVGLVKISVEKRRGCDWSTVGGATWWSPVDALDCWLLSRSSRRHGYINQLGQKHQKYPLGARAPRDNVIASSHGWRLSCQETSSVF